MSSSRPTIRDVAALAGVSVSTVSRVLNDFEFVDAGTRERVLDATQTLGYARDETARAMRTGRSRAVGFVVDDFANPLFSAHAKGADELLRADGYALILANSDKDLAREAEAVTALRQRRVDALLIALVSETDCDSSKLLNGFRSVVLLDREIHGFTGDAVWPDHGAGLRQAIDHLVSLGHDRIALVAGKTDQRGSRVRIESYREHVHALGLPWDPALVQTGLADRDTGYSALMKLFQLERPPSAVIAGSNRLFVGVAHAVRDRGLRIPQDLSVITCDDVDASALHEPPIDVVERDAAGMGRAAAELALTRLADPSAPPRKRMISTTFLARGSSAPYGDSSSPGSEGSSS
ncbi:MAG: LacI family DNA-binding transcriptional regulator [Gaiellaceae bacterium]